MECDATAWLVDFLNPYSHRHRGRNPFAQHLNYPKIDSSTKDYPKTTLIFFAFYRTLRKCVKALSENYSTKYWNFCLTIRNAKKNYPKVFPSSNSRPRQYTRSASRERALRNASQKQMVNYTQRSYGQLATA